MAINLFTAISALVASYEHVKLSVVQFPYSRTHSSNPDPSTASSLNEGTDVKTLEGVE